MKLLIAIYGVSDERVSEQACLLKEECERQHVSVEVLSFPLLKVEQPKINVESITSLVRFAKHFTSEHITFRNHDDPKLELKISQKVFINSIKYSKSEIIIVKQYFYTEIARTAPLGIRKEIMEFGVSDFEKPDISIFLDSNDEKLRKDLLPELRMFREFASRFKWKIFSHDEDKKVANGWVWNEIFMRMNN